MLRRLNLLLTCCYPPAIHFALLASQTRLALLFLIVVSVTQLIANLVSTHVSTQGSRYSIVVPVIVLALCVYGVIQDSPFALFLPPVMISAGLLWIFAGSLRQGREAIISRFARVVFNEQDPVTLSYTRRVTQLWSLFFVAMLLETILLAVLAPLDVWSLFANILNYLFIALLFLVEFIYRRFHFPKRLSTRELMQHFRSANWSELLKSS